MRDTHTGRTPVGVLGAGYVGATTAAGMLMLGHQVVVVEQKAEKVQQFRHGRCPVPEPGLSEVFSTTQTHVDFCTDPASVAGVSILFVCVPTPGHDDGRADTTVAYRAIDDAARHLDPGSIIVLKSTVPVGTADDIRKRLAHRQIDVVSNPEFLREGYALADFLEPSRIVIGGASVDSIARVGQLYDALPVPVVETDNRTAELAKYACNSFLALKLSYVNELSDTAAAVGADIDAATRIMGLDPRIGPHHLSPGPGWGGSCLPKDSRALVATAADAGTALSTVSTAIESNETRMRTIASRLGDLARSRNPVNPTVGILGLTFKPGTTDLAQSPALRIADELTSRGIRVVAHDPTRPEPGDLDPRIEVVESATTALAGGDATALLTDWPEYRGISADCDMSTRGQIGRCPQDVGCEMR